MRRHTGCVDVAALAAEIGIDPARSYDARELVEKGIFRNEGTPAAWRYRTRRDGRQHGPSFYCAGGRCLYTGAAVLRWIAWSTAREAA